MALSELELIRREKREELINGGINPYPAHAYNVTHLTSDIAKNFKEGETVSIAGRLMSRRIQGKASFAELQDSKGRIQVYFNRDEICPGEDKSLYNEVYKKLLDIGDFVGITGELFTTKVGEKTVMVKSFEVLAKAVKPLPLPKTDAEGNTYDSFKDPELRYRQRYVDLVINNDVKQTFVKRTKLFNAMRSFFNDKEYLEVETPILQPIPGGAAASPFVTHHNALGIPLYLRIANELYLKRLVVGGFDGVYEFSKNFRNEGMDRTHNPEFTAMEIYVAYKDYNWMMDFTESLLEYVAQEVNASYEVQYGKENISFKAPYPRVTMRDSIIKYAGIDIDGLNLDELKEKAKAIGVTVDDTMGKGKIIDEIFGEKCEANYRQPTFITDYPVEMSPLCKQHRDNPAYTERFELFCCGKEIANAYSELNDPIEQRARFQEQLKLSEKGDDEAMFIDNDFLRALEYGMPPTAGLGIGMDRLLMLLTGKESIQEVLFFPQMRPEQKLDLNEDEQLVFELLKLNNSIELNLLKEQSELSNKKWDKAIKGLTKKKVAKVSKTDEGLYVTLIN